MTQLGYGSGTQNAARGPQGIVRGSVRLRLVSYSKLQKKIHCIRKF